MSASSADSHTDFFVAGGTVPPGAPSYVERVADKDLLDALLKGEYCYVLNSRQMGKSSLAVRTIAKLEGANVRTAFVDLTRLGGSTVSSEQWYAGLLVETGRTLGMRSEAVAHLRDQREVGPVQRYLGFLHETALPAANSPLVLMIDEIDAVRSLAFSTDELFAGIRQLYNGRAGDQSLLRLTVCLLGAALPSDLIRDPRTTPFNVGRRIELRDFTTQEALPFAAPLGPNGEARLKRVLYWTGGHPFLTQSICAAIAADPLQDVDVLVRASYLDVRARDTDTHLADVGNRLLGRGDPGVDDVVRADTLAKFAQVRRHGIADDESNPAAARIKMSGVARMDENVLTIRNEIYRRVFDAEWIRENTPGQELRRQRRAYWRGALRTTAIATGVVGVIGWQAWTNARQRDAARYDAYVASMQTLPLARDRHNLAAINRVLASQRDNPARGWEWSFWHRVANRAEWVIHKTSSFPGVTVSPDSRQMVLRHTGSIDIYSLPHGQRLRSIPAPPTDLVVSAFWLPDARRIVTDDGRGNFVVLDAESGKVLRRATLPGVNLPFGPGRSGTRWVIATGSEGRQLVFDLEALTAKPIANEAAEFPLLGNSSIGGTRVVLGKYDEARNVTKFLVLEVPSAEPVARLTCPGLIHSSVLTAQGTQVVLGRSDGVVLAFALKTGSLLWKKRVALGTLTAVSTSDDDRWLLFMSEARQGFLVEQSNQRARVVQSFADAGYVGMFPNGEALFTTYSDDIQIFRPTSPPEIPDIRLGAGGWAGRIDPRGPLHANQGERFYDVDLLNPTAIPQRKEAVEGFTLGDANVAGWFTVAGGRVSLLDPATKAVRTHFPQVTSNTGWSTDEEFAASPDGRWVVASTGPSSATVLDVTTIKPVFRLPIESRMYAAAFKADGSQLAIAETGGRVTVWRTRDWTLVSETRTAKWIRRLRFSPDGTRLAGCGQADTGVIIDIASGRQIAELVGHAQTVCSIAWSPDGRRLATGSQDRTVRIWDTETGRELGTLGLHGAPVVEVGFLPGGRTLATFSVDGTLKLWMTEARR